jgi:hypothetical protein
MASSRFFEGRSWVEVQRVSGVGVCRAAQLGACPKTVASAPRSRARLQARLRSRRRTQEYEQYFEDDDRRLGARSRFSDVL